MSARETAELLLLVGRLVQAEGYDGELSPAQWMALRFFARANPFSRTPSAFAEFQATTRGTASQAIKAREAGGYLVRQRSEADGRSRNSATDGQEQRSACARIRSKFWCGPWTRPHPQLPWSALGAGRGASRFALWRRALALEPKTLSWAEPSWWRRE
jgi:DNA-binding MarR family transcriptional regulator